jgi:gluconokinase
MITKFVIMGVSGCGKSSIGAGFADQIGAEFVDGDNLHPEANIAKMAAGNPLSDMDRAPWLNAVGLSFTKHGLSLVIGCSALKRSYRDIIRAAAGGPVAFLHLDGARHVIAARMAKRTGHFMPAALLDSQLESLEQLGLDELAVCVDIDQRPEAIVAELIAHFRKDT